MVKDYRERYFNKHRDFTNQYPDLKDEAYSVLQSYMESYVPGVTPPDDDFCNYCDDLNNLIIGRYTNEQGL